MDIEKRIGKSKRLAIVALIFFGIYLCCLIFGPSKGLEELAKFFIASAICVPFILVGGIRSLLLGWSIRKTNREVLFWLIPVFIALFSPVLFVLVCILMETFAASNLFFK